jgi:hypothetical protein
MFLLTIRWSTLRYRPKRETRGVSRSKCGDLITATVPVSWAASIIVHESTDAIDFFDGFGTTELAVGIRAYQWGWEYYYPKDLDLNYKINSNQSLFIGNSLKYETIPSKSTAINFWRFYQSKYYDSVVNPLNFLLLNTKTSQMTNKHMFSLIGLPLNDETYAFKRMYNISKYKNYFQNVSTVTNLNTLSYFKIYNNLFENNQSYTYKLNRDHMLLNTMATKPLTLTYLDFKSLNNIYTNLLSDPKLLNKLSDDYTVSFKDIDTNLLPNYTLTPDVSHNFVFKNLTNFNLKILDDSLNVRSKTNFSLLEDNPTKTFLKTPLNNKNAYLNKNSLHTKINQRLLEENSLDFFNSKVLKFSESNPIKSNNNTFNVKLFDSFYKSPIDQQSYLFSGKDEYIPNVYKNSTNVSNFNTLNNNIRIYQASNLINLLSTQTFVLPEFFIDNSIKKWQTFDLFEDIFWDSTNSIYNILEYKTLMLNSDVAYVPTKLFKFFSLDDAKLVNNSFKINFIKLNFNTNVSVNDYNLTKLHLNKNNFIQLSDYSNVLQSLEDNFVASKTLHNFTTHYNLVLSNLNYKNFNSTLSTIDTFKDNFESFFLFTNSTVKLNTNSVVVNELISYYLLDLINSKFINNFITTPLSHVKQNNSNDLISSTKNTLTYYSALQKVYKTRFDEGRSTTRFEDFSATTSKLPLVSVKQPNLNYSIYKNWNAYTKYNFLTQSLSLNYFNSNVNNQITNYYYYDLPFLISIKSDSSRYIWIDWFAKWGSVDLQAISYSKQGLYGMPQFSHTFDFNPNISETYMENENYISRLNIARRLTLPNWTYTPYFYFKTKCWFSNLFNEFNNIKFETNLIKSFFMMDTFNLIWFSNYTNTISNFSNLFSNVDIPGRNFWQAYNNTNMYYLYVTELVDTLVKREYIYRKYFEFSSKIISLPTSLIANTNNPLVKEFQSLYESNTLTLNDLNYKRDIYFNLSTQFSTLFYLTNSFETYLNHFKTKLSYKKFYLDLFGNYNDIFKNTKQFKSNYKPLKRGISNMIRLHASGAIAMPTEIRLQLLASSRDVIHSWSIPSAGIKIDCIPGYSSHRLAIFFSNGVYWGQCMEICGRYHHWMPIVVYFMKRDLFFLWCLHFVLMKDSNNLDSIAHWNINSPRLVTFDKLTWLNEYN